MRYSRIRSVAASPARPVPAAKGARVPVLGLGASPRPTSWHAPGLALGISLWLSLLLGAVPSGVAAAGELYVYRTPGGVKLYTDQIMQSAAYQPLNGSARRARKGLPPVRLVAAASAPGRVDALIRRLAPEYRLDPKLVHSVVEAESAYRSRAVSHAGAQGLMQLIPATAERFGVKDVFDPEQNLRGGMSYLRWLIDHFDGDLNRALAGYNAGENAVKRHDGIPPYRETQRYVKKVLARYAEHRDRAGPAPVVATLGP